MGRQRRFPIKRKENESGEHEDLKYAISSMQGWRREMEDRHHVNLSLESGPKLLRNWAFAGVFDGHSGKRASEYSSDMLLEKILSTIKRNMSFSSGPGQIKMIETGIRKGFLNCDKTMKRCGISNDGSGTTAVCVMISPTHYYFANCGDSRALLCQAGKVKFATKDHKPDNRMEKKRIKNAGGYVKRHRVIGRLALSRALGDFEYKMSKGKSECEQMVIPEPDITTIERNHELDEFLVLACDGIFDVMGNQELITFIRTQMAIAKSLKVVCNRVVDRCFQKGSTDNMSIVILTLPGCPSYEELQKKRNEEFEKMKDNLKRTRKDKEDEDTPGPVMIKRSRKIDKATTLRRKNKVPNPYILYFLDELKKNGGNVCKLAKICGRKWKHELRTERKSKYQKLYLQSKLRLRGTA